MSSISQFLNSGPLVWFSGMTVNQWQDVISPADGETYRRKTATGSGTTDPSDDRTNYRPVSFDRVISQSNKTSYSNGNDGTLDFYGTVHTGTPALTANARTSLLSISGKGELNFVALQAMGSVGVTTRFEVIIDGAAIFDVTDAGLSGGTNRYLVAVGSANTAVGGYGYTAAIFDRVRFSKSAQVFITCSGNPGTGFFKLKTFYKGYQS